MSRADEYWSIIRWDPTGFLTVNDGGYSRILHADFKPSMWRDIMLQLRGVASGTVRSAIAIAASTTRGLSCAEPPAEPYALIISMGTDKYASEEHEMIQACREAGLTVRSVHVGAGPIDRGGCQELSIRCTMTGCDHVVAYCRWLAELGKGFESNWASDPVRRSLSAAAVSAVWQYQEYKEFARRIVAMYGRPLFVFSQAPWSTISVAIVEYMKSCRVLTAAIRTQTTFPFEEHLAINTDLLFCKSPMERDAYHRVFGGRGPRLIDGCLLSLPAGTHADLLALPEAYVLVLGTAPALGQSEAEYRRFNCKLFRVAATLGLPIVYKGHDLSQEFDRKWFRADGAAFARCVRVTDIQRNRELIDRCAFLVSPPSTLLYYGILRQKPIILVELELNATIPDEFASAPLQRIAWNADIPEDQVARPQALEVSAVTALHWFNSTYFLDKGPAFMIRSLLAGSRLREGGGGE